MRILHTNMQRGWTPQANQILREAQTARTAGHAVALVVPQDSCLFRRARESGFECLTGYDFKLPAKLWHFLPEVRRFRRDVLDWRPDLIHLHSSRDTWLAMTTKRLLEDRFPRTVRTKHTPAPWKPHRLNRWVYQAVDAYITTSVYTDRQVKAFPGLARKPRRLIRPTLDQSRLKDAKPLARQTLGIASENAFLWGVACRLRREKDISLLLKALAVLRRQRTDAHLLVIGDGPERSQLEAEAKLLSLGPEALTFLGFRRDVAELFKTIDAYVAPCVEKGRSTSLLEAMTCGLPVVTTKTAGLPNFIVDRENALLVDANSPECLAAGMQELMEDAALTQRLGAAASTSVDSEFCEHHSTGEALAFYESLLAGALISKT